MKVKWLNGIFFLFGELILGNSNIKCNKSGLNSSCIVEGLMIRVVLVKPTSLLIVAPCIKACSTRLEG